MDYKYCSQCGQRLTQTDEKKIKRSFCQSCNLTFYRNPTVGVAVVILEKDKILLVKRSGSDKDKWCIPCGHVEWNEDIRQSAIREIQEETGLIVKLGDVVNVHSNFHDMEKQTVGVWFFGYPVGGELRAGSDASEAAFYSLYHLPAKMAFPTDLLICEQLLDDM